MASRVHGASLSSMVTDRAAGLLALFLIKVDIMNGRTSHHGS